MINLGPLLDEVAPNEEPEYKLERYADCLDCEERVLLIETRWCGKCGGSQWLPVGYFDRRKFRGQSTE